MGQPAVVKWNMQLDFHIQKHTNMVTLLVLIPKWEGEWLFRSGNKATLSRAEAWACLSLAIWSHISVILVWLYFVHK